MNEDTPQMNNSYSRPTPSKEKSKKKLVTLLIILGLLVIAVAVYAFFANENKLWPFTANSPVATTEPSLKIEKVKLSDEKDKENLDIKLKLNSEDTGYCVLTMTSKLSILTIDDSKTKQDPQATVPLENCLGWNIGTAGLPNGTYKLDVKFVGSKTKLSTSDTVKLENRAAPVQTSEDN